MRADRPMFHLTLLTWLTWVALPSGSAAQGTSCLMSPPPPRALAEGWYVLPQAAWSDDTRTLILGWPRYRFSVVPGTDSIQADSAFAGLEIGTDGRARPIPLPPGSGGMRDPRLVVRGDGAFMLHSADRGEAPGGLGTSDSLTVFMRRWSGARWESSREVVVLPRSMNVERDISSDLVIDGSSAVWLMPLQGRNGFENLLEIRVDPRRGSTRALRTTHNFVAQTDLAITPAGMRAALVAVTPDTIDGEFVAMHGIWLYQSDDRAWRPLARLAEGRDVQYQQPRLFQTEDDLILAYRLRDRDRVRMEWRSVRSDAEEWNRLDIRGAMQRGQQDWADVLTVGVSDTVALVLRLRSDGADTLARLPTVSGHPPLVTGTRRDPLAIGLRLGGVPQVPVQLVRYDLACLSEARRPLSK